MITFYDTRIYCIEDLFGYAMHADERFVSCLKIGVSSRYTIASDTIVIDISLLQST